eukprot:scaffold3941_cov412-Prasinococcus_capsulatus_cf.AAC.1
MTGSQWVTAAVDGFGGRQRAGSKWQRLNDVLRKIEQWLAMAVRKYPFRICWCHRRGCCAAFVPNCRGRDLILHCSLARTMRRIHDLVSALRTGSQSCDCSCFDPVHASLCAGALLLGGRSDLEPWGQDMRCYYHLPVLSVLQRLGLFRLLDARLRSGGSRERLGAPSRLARSWLITWCLKRNSATTLPRETMLLHGGVRAMFNA